jgi:Family of unknown function (DUF6353)
MNLAFVSRAIGAAQLALKAHAPTIMVTGGVVAMGAGSVVACKKTLKVEEVLEKHTTDLERIREGQSLKLDSYTQDDARNDRLKVYTRASWDLTKLYAVPGVLFVGGALTVFAGHRLLLRRNATLAVAFTAVFEAFEKYRERVRAEQGSDFDQAMLTGYTVKEVIDDDGKVRAIATRDWDNMDEIDPYNRVFGQGESREWVHDLSINRMYVTTQQKFAQRLLNNRGYLWLSEVYESLGFEVNDIARVTGWKVRILPDGTKDIPVVDFGLDKPHPDDWKYSQDKAIYLDFNCQGLIVGGKIQKILEASS